MKRDARRTILLASFYLLMLHILKMLTKWHCGIPQHFYENE